MARSVPFIRRLPVLWSRRTHARDRSLSAHGSELSSHPCIAPSIHASIWADSPADPSAFFRRPVGPRSALGSAQGGLREVFRAITPQLSVTAPDRASAPDGGLACVAGVGGGGARSGAVQWTVRQEGSLEKNARGAKIVSLTQRRAEAMTEAGGQEGRQEVGWQSQELRKLRTNACARVIDCS